MNKKAADNFNQFFDQNYLSLKQFLKKYCANDNLIEDILQESFSDLYKSFHKIEYDKRREWIYARAIQHAQALEQKNCMEAVGENPIEADNEHSEKVWVQENLDIIREVLTDEEFKLIYLYHVQNYTRKEIVKMLDMPITPDALQMRITRIRAKVRRELKRKTPDWYEN